MGITDMFHSLRDRFGTHLYRSTKDLVLTADLMGHGSVNTTQLYAAADASKGPAAVAALGRPPSG